MIRVILRYIQNTLVISAALLVILAWQRMQSFDYSQNHPYNHFSHHADYSSEYVDESHGLFGRQVSVGLFRFVFPSREKTETALAPTRPTVSLRKRGSKQEKTPPSKRTIVFAVDIVGCEAHWMDAAAILQHSISMQRVTMNRESVVQLHALLSGALFPVCGQRLRNIGFKTVDRDTIHLPIELEKYRADSCISDNVRTAIYYSNLDGVDLVVHLPLPSLVLPINFNHTASQKASRGSMQQKKEANTNEKVAGLINVQRPSQEDKKALVQDVLSICSNHSDAKDSTGTPLLSWKNGNSSFDLKFANAVALNTCPLPWHCESQQNQTKQEELPCHIFQEKWFQLRREIENKLVIDIVSNDDFSRDDLRNRYCQNSGPEGYRAMQF